MLQEVYGAFLNPGLNIDDCSFNILYTRTTITANEHFSKLDEDQNVTDKIESQSGSVFFGNSHLFVNKLATLYNYAVIR